VSNRYKVLLPLQVNGHTQGETFEHEFTVEEERNVIDSGLLEIVPRSYRVLTDTRVHETGKDDTFEAALLIEQEAHLVNAGFVERADPPEPPTPKTKPQKEAKK
jgi:hypothetical protein